MRSTLFRLAIACTVPWSLATAQQAPAPITRAAALDAALARGPRLGVIRSDTLLATAQRITAGAIPNPQLSASYSKSTPNYHLTADWPIDFLWLRNTRIRSAEAAQRAARYQFSFDRASLLLETDTTYTRALAALAHVNLSQRNALAADSVRRIAVIRRDAGDASELDVQLATVTAGQAANAAAADTLTLAATLLDLQALLGMPTDHIAIMPSDSLIAPDALPAAVPADSTLPVAKATASVEAASLNARLQRRSAFPFPGIMFGFETGDPTGAEPGILPTFGVSLPLPLFNHNRGPIAEADAAKSRALAELGLARIQTANEIAQAQRAEGSALARVARDAQLVQSANRVADMSLISYREGAAPLTTVLEAQARAREVLSQYIDDVAAAAIAATTLRTLTLTPRTGTMP